jgi:alkylation response protein AidB-like acyl-CoA dehydrogenase
MDFTLPPHIEDYRRRYRAFVAEHLLPLELDPEAYDDHENIRLDVLEKMRAQARAAGLWAPQMPKEIGGQGLSVVGMAACYEEANYSIFGPVTFNCAAPDDGNMIVLNKIGTEEQKRRWLPALCAGEALGAFGLTEPGGGSDAGATQTTARRDGDEWVINGSKAFITNSGTSITSLVTVTAVTGRDGDRKQISSIIVPAGTPGFTVSKKYSKVGWNASDTRELSFADCRVPVSNLVGVEGRGYAQFLSILDEGRVAIAALSVGLAQGCVDECVRYVGERSAFGHLIGSYQAIQFKIADMEARAHTARLAYYAAAAKLVRGEPFKKEAAIAKLVASNAAMDNARDATQIFGGYGFMNEFPVGRFYRDAKILEIGEGTSEVQRMLIARELGLG